MACCGSTPPEELLLAVRQFNEGEWFECHETLEELWVGTQGELRDFYQGFLQLAVALHHLQDGNLKGALFLLESGGGMLRRVPVVCQGVDAAGLAVAAAKLHQAVLERGEELVAGLPAELVPKARLAE